MTTHIIYVNGKTLPRVAHNWYAGDGPCHFCQAPVGEIHRILGCSYEECPKCGELWTHCQCKTVDAIPNHGKYAWRYPWLTIEHLEDAEGRPYEMRVEEEAE